MKWGLARLINELDDSIFKKNNLTHLTQKNSKQQKQQKNSTKNNIPKAKAQRKGTEQAFAKTHKAETTRKAKHESEKQFKTYGGKKI